MLHEPLHLMKRNASLRARAGAIGRHLRYRNHQDIDTPTGKLWMADLSVNWKERESLLKLSTCS
jgi:hypothetical protein